MSLKRAVPLAIVLVIIAAAAFGAWTVFLRPVRVAVAGTARDVPVRVFGLGTVEARVTSKVGFKVGGVLVDLRADVGERVPKGAVLARLDDREQRARVARAAAAVQQAEANVQKANASVQKSLTNYDNAKRINERRQALVQSKTASVETGENAQAVQEAALADVNLAKARCWWRRPRWPTLRRSSSRKWPRSTSTR
jgi:HlyD family secretion protein